MFRNALKRQRIPAWHKAGWGYQVALLTQAPTARLADNGRHSVKENSRHKQRVAQSGSPEKIAVRSALLCAVGGGAGG